MTVPRNEIYNPENVGVYHCISRCVRRAYLCGKDSLTGNSYEHRRVWVRDRLKRLSEIFAIDLFTYAVMMNHLHMIIRNRPDLALLWSAEEVARRWRLLFPLRYEFGRPATPSQQEIEAIVQNPPLVDIYRKRLSNISWFNRCLCESIARRANREDKCTGRFWEGRFKSQRILDIRGVLTCSAYIDLNPIRAGIATTPEESDFTGIQDRIRALKSSKTAELADTRPKLVSIEELSDQRLSTLEYFEIVDASGRAIVQGKGRIPESCEEILKRLGINHIKWKDTATHFRDRFRRIVGPVEMILSAAKETGKAWFHGINSARTAFC